MKELTFAASLENIPVVTAFIDEQLEVLDCPMKPQMQIDIVIDELFGNIARYAYGDGTCDATVRFEFDGPTRTASVTFIDGGVPFDPLQKPDPDVTLSAEERAVGGLGIFMVKKTMDRVEYRRENSMNILTIYKNI
ncbi:MAG: ATP-binding protein [Clostridia bacterium]|nr:ATP-binding protein [Clostridia bacterium]